MRRASRRDTIHGAVRNIFESTGFGVLDLAGVGDGVPDLAVFRRGVGFLVEVKSPNAIRGGRVNDPLRDSQKDFAADWSECPIHIVETLEAAWKLVEQYNPSTRKQVP